MSFLNALGRQSTRTRLPCLVRPLSSSVRLWSPAQTPWFVQDEELTKGFALRQNPPHLPPKDFGLQPPPRNAPEVLKDLHALLAPSPLLETSTLIVTQPSEPPPGPPLPFRLPQGRRKRGGTYAGESEFEVPGGIWNWILMAQVKEGTENRGAIESVVRTVRKSLLLKQPPLPLPPNSKKRLHNGWALIDCGDFAVHILSKVARDKYFSW
ncbi:hypothetical protein BDN72DRAFT_831074 [Pluteus cervinus]|uniref:Uncharacterized protein n=1 Tax=Pluteus cervinus TaxID=181527 RepID=A0ACD3BF39_9AGAR|nr:hypothetical protein BDN72DRAFT_831074 [Pluteus cervinus]